MIAGGYDHHLSCEEAADEPLNDAGHPVSCGCPDCDPPECAHPRPPAPVMPRPAARGRAADPSGQRREVRGKSALWLDAWCG